MKADKRTAKEIVQDEVKKMDDLLGGMKGGLRGALKSVLKENMPNISEAELNDYKNSKNGKRTSTVANEAIAGLQAFKDLISQFPKQ